MRHIVKHSLDSSVQKYLDKKQQNIDSGKTIPNWRLTDNQREEITGKLLKSQKYICCYCECNIDSNNNHVEHFFEQEDFPNQIYDYKNNLILSCEGERNPKFKPEPSSTKRKRKKNISCGHKKSQSYHGNKEVNYDLLLNPMKKIANLFRYDDMGNVKPSSANPQEISKVQYTIKRINLQSKRLINYRIDAIVEIQNQLDGLTVEEEKQFVKSLLDNSQTSLPAFYSTINDNFGFIINE